MTDNNSSPEAVLKSTQERLKTEYKKNGLVKGCPMDDANAKAAAIMTTEGPDAAVKHMCENPDGSTRSYAEMRMLYG